MLLEDALIQLRGSSSSKLSSQFLSPLRIYRKFKSYQGTVNLCFSSCPISNRGDVDSQPAQPPVSGHLGARDEYSLWRDHVDWGKSIVCSYDECIANRSLQLQRLPSHTRYPLTPSRLITTTTPSAQRSISRFTPRGRPSMAPSTPYGLRARQQRAANTPGRDRRRSGRVQRETTFDILRNLGRSMRISVRVVTLMFVV